MSANLPTLTLCATARLSRAMQLQMAHTGLQWQTPQILTLEHWLANFTQFAMLAGELDLQAFPRLALSNISEKILWQQAIQGALSKHALADLFDISSLADSAIEANQLLTNWQISDAVLNGYFQSVETRQFTRWRHDFQALCAQHSALEPARLLAFQINCVLASSLALPHNIELAGFDRITPLMQYLIDGLAAKGVQIAFAQAAPNAPQMQQLAFDDLDAECRAAAVWAKQTLGQNPQANLAIITPILGNIRAKLADLLDDIFHPESVNPSQYEAARMYDFSLGLPLSEHALIASALHLLRLAASKQAASQATISAILLSIYWGDANELDARSLLDAQMRKKLPRNISLQALVNLAQKRNESGALLALLQHLTNLQISQKNWQKKQAPSLWAAQFSDLLAHLHWAQTRSLSSHEHQAKQSWLEALQRLAELDALSNNMSAIDAVNRLAQICTAKMFQPESIGDTRLQILGMLETSATVLDGAWILGMNDQHWPPPAKPNPLLPIALQRDFYMPNADTDIQAAFAQKIHNRIINSANQTVFSWSRKDGDRELRASPLLAQLPFGDAIMPAITLAENLSQPAQMQWLNDSMAPPILPTEKLRGGSKLFETQAICPAWTFYQYRLGAVRLESPSDGLDSMERGNLLHAVLEHFWRDCKSLNQLNSLSKIQLEDALQASIHAGLAQINLSEFVPKQIIEIEAQRLQTLLQTWLALEKERTDFTVQSCEADFLLPIEGLEVKLRVDRIDALENGELVIIDYKTGSAPPNHSNWADARISSPQLPLYASLALKGQRVVGACFAKVNVFECKFSGLAEGNILPNVTAFADLKSNSAFKKFEDFDALIAHWQQSLTAIAVEIKTGVAGVLFENEADLLYCDVKPLLRLPERELQFEQSQLKQAQFKSPSEKPT